MNIIELYSGTSDLTKELRKRGHYVVDYDWSVKSPAMRHCDISDLTIEDLRKEFPNGKIDFIWASPDCTTYSNAGLWYHRFKCPAKGLPAPKSPYAKVCDEYNRLLWENILNKCDCPYIVENPVGQYTKLNCITAPYRYLIRYNEFGADSVKPTHFFTNIPYIARYLDSYPSRKEPQLKGIKGTQHKSGHLKRGRIPHDLIVAIADLIEFTYINGGK